MERKIQTEFETGEHIFFTSDTHFNHEKIIEYCNRPFSSVDEMNRVLIDNWNRVVDPDDTVFHLGDFAWGGSTVWNNILNQLNGHIVLIIGNHDMKNLKNSVVDRFDYVTYQMQILIENTPIYLNHFPFLCFGGAYRGESAVWQLFGHVHSSERTKGGLDVQRLIHLFPTQYDVGVDNNNFCPVRFDQVKSIIETQQMSLNMHRN